MTAFADLLTASGLEFRSGLIVLPTWCQRIKIDVGLSSNAPQSARWLRDDPSLLVIGFDPVEENLRQIASGTSPHPTRLDPSLVGVRFFPIRAAIGNVPELRPVDIYVTETDAGCSSAFRPKAFKVERVETSVQVPLEQVLDAIPLDGPPIHYLKVDAQGSDFEVLKSAGRSLQRVLAVTAEAETQQYQGPDNSRTSISRHLRGLGFSPWVPLDIRRPRRTIREVLATAPYFDVRVLQAQRLRKKISVEDPTYLQFDRIHEMDHEAFGIFQQG